MRKAVSVNLVTVPEHESKVINTWLDNQQNQQLSLVTLLVHAIEHLGYADIMSYSMQRKLHTTGLQSTLIDTPEVYEHKVHVPTPKEEVSVKQTVAQEPQQDRAPIPPIKVNGQSLDTPETPVNKTEVVPNKIKEEIPVNKQSLPGNIYDEFS